MSSPVTRSAPATPSSICAARSYRCCGGCTRRCARRTRPATSARTRSAAGWTSTHGARRRGRVHLRRGDRAARLAGGPARPAPAASSLPGRRGPVRVPHRGEQRRVHRLGSRDPQQGQGLVPVDGQREVPRLHALLAQRPRRQPRPVRGPARHHPAPAARHERRHAPGPPAEVLDPGRLLHPDVHRRAPRRPARLRGRRRGRAPCSAPRRSSASTRRPAWCGPSPAGPSSTPTSPAASAPPAARAPTGSSSCCATSRPARAAWPTSTSSNDIADNINGKSFCALGDGAAAPIFSSLKYFREEYEQHITGKGCPFDPARSPLWADQTHRR